MDFLFPKFPLSFHEGHPKRCKHPSFTPWAFHRGRRDSQGESSLGSRWDPNQAHLLGLCAAVMQSRCVFGQVWGGMAASPAARVPRMERPSKDKSAVPMRGY